jgi:benzoate/toluate 1,2-dioxygenase alpha subunit
MTAQGGFDVSPLVDDRLATDGVFRVDRQIYMDPAIFAREMDVFYENNWVYLCHESQIANPGDYFATHIGRQPVFANRRKDGGIGAYINACSHRAAILTPYQRGNARTLTCRFHGWSYADDGRCIRIKGEAEGFPQDGFDRSCFDLTKVARVESYRGFVFGSLSAEVPPLAEHLNDARVFLDMFADQSPEGMEIVPGSQTYVCDHDWKVQVENVPDGYHVSTVHRNFMATVMAREERDALTGLHRTETGRMRGVVRSGCYDFPRGHTLVWNGRADPDAAPVFPLSAEIERRCGPVRAEWMLRRGRNLCVFPNLVLNDLASTHLRVHRPLGPGKCEVTIWCIAPKGEPREARIARLRKFEDFFLVTGMATSDDLVSLNVAQEGCAGRAARWTDFARGAATVTAGPDEDARALGINPLSSNASWELETMYYGLYRYWRDALNAGTPNPAMAQAAE